MARLNIEECWWTDPRREALGRLIGSIDLADAMAIRMWRLAQEFWKQNRGMVPKDLFDMLPHADKLIQCRLADVRDAFVYVRGSSVYLEWAYEKKVQAKEAGKKSAEARRAKTGSAQPKPRTKPERTPNAPRTEVNEPEPSVSGFGSVSVSGTDSVVLFAPGSETPDASGKELDPNGPSVTALTWRSYRDAYQRKYEEPPTWNQKIGGQLKHFVSRVPKDEAPLIAAFYLTHSDQYYVKSMHPVGLLLRDAEKLRTEWATGRKMTGFEAKQAEQKDANVEAMKKYLARKGLA